MKILVTGSGGLLGGAVARAARGRGHDLCALDRAALDVTDSESVESRLRDEAPEAVMHCAGYTAVDDAEEEPDRAMAVNRDGTRIVALAAAAIGASLVYPSTDYVFDGRSDRPYRPGDETHPVNAYGQSKLAGEKVLETTDARWAVVRTSWLYGPDGKDFIDVILGARYRSSPLKIVNDQVGCPTWTDSLAPALVELAERGAIGTYHLCDRGKATWLDLARGAAICANLDVELEATTTEAWGAPADRPRYSVLDSSKAEALLGRSMPMWGESVRAHLEAIE